MRIGYVISRYPAVSHTFIQREVLGLRELGWDVTTFSIRAATPADLLTETDRAEQQRTHAILPATIPAIVGAAVSALVRSPQRFFRACGTGLHLRRPGAKGFVWSLFYILEAFLVHRICRREGITHLHAHFANVASDVAMIASVLNAGTFSYTMHGPTEFFEVSAHRLPEKTRAAKFVLCISDFARSQLMSMIPHGEWNKLHILHCGVDPKQFEMVRRERRGRPLSGEWFHLLCVARQVPVKAHAILLQAIALLAKAGENVSLTLVGDGPLRGELSAFAAELGLSDRVTFAGNVGQDVIARHFGRADLFVLPSFAEGVPVVLMEAMAAGCPVLATRIAGISELIEQGREGLLVPAGRADLLADAILQLKNNPVERRAMAQEAEKKIAFAFNLTHIAPQLAGIFERSLGVTVCSNAIKTATVEVVTETEELNAMVGEVAS